MTKKEVIYLDVDDDITTVIDKVESAEDKKVALVLPKRFATLQSIVNMRLLARSAKSAAKDLSLVTSEAALLPLAGAAGLKVAKNLQSEAGIPPSPLDAKAAVAEEPDADVDPDTAKLDYHRSVGELAAAKTVDEPETIPLEDAEEAEPAAATAKKPKSKKLKVPNFDKFRLILGLGIAGGVLLIIFLIMAIFVWPKATITLKAEATPISANFELNATDAAKTLDLEKGVIPSELEKSDLTREENVQATGQRNDGQKATGSVTIKNCTDNAVTIPAGTGVSTSGLAYITQQSASLDSGNFDGGGNCKTSGSHTKTVNVTAQQGGAKYNIGAGQTFSVSGKPSGVTGSNSSAFSGGTDAIVTVLSQQDADAVKAKITDQDKNQFVDKFKKDLDSAGFYAVQDSLKATDPAVTASPAVGQAASTAKVTVKITYSVLVVKKDDLRKAVSEQLEKEIDKQRQKIGTDDVLKDTTVTVQNQSSPTAATLTVSVDTTAVPIVDEAGIKAQVMGKKAGEIKALLRDYPGINEVEVDMSPFWVSKAPKKAGKITIVLEQVKTQDSGSPRDTRP